jgi:hypothetical protein
MAYMFPNLPAGIAFEKTVVSGATVSHSVTQPKTIAEVAI